MKNMQTRQKLV